MSLEGDDEFTGKLRLPLPPKFSGKPHEWEEWSWTFKAYLSMFDAQAAAFMDQHELDPDEVTDEDLAVNVQDELGGWLLIVRLLQGVSLLVESCTTCLQT